MKGWGTVIGVILCGGLGSRLRPAVPDLPKAMAPVKGRPFLEYQIESLARSSIREIVLCVGYRWEAIHSHFGGGQRFGANLHYSVEESPLGTAGCLKLAEPLIAEPALVLNGDTFLGIDPHAMRQHHLARRAAVTVAVIAVPDATEYGTVAMDGQNRILAFREKQGGSGFVNAGAYLIEPAVLRYMKPGEPYSMEVDLLPSLLHAGEPIYAYPLAGPFLDIGTPERYQAAQGGWDCS